MRSLGLVLLVPLVACRDNPRFELNPAPTEASDTTAAGPATSDEPDPTTTTTTTTATTATTTITTTQGTTSTSEPLTSTSEPATTGTDGETGKLDMPAACNFISASDQTRYVHEAGPGEPKVNQCGAPETYFGSLEMTAGGDLRLHKDDADCSHEGDPATHILGKHWPSIKPREYGCVRATIFWKKTPDECQIGALRIHPQGPNMGDLPPLYMAGLSYPVPNPGLPLWPVHVLDQPCKCDGQKSCCVPEEPGGYSLSISGDDVAPNTETSVKIGSVDYRFLNIQSYIGLGCQDNPPTDIHFDWFAERTQ